MCAVPRFPCGTSVFSTLTVCYFLAAQAICWGAVAVLRWEDIPIDYSLGSRSWYASIEFDLGFAIARVDSATIQMTGSAGCGTRNCSYYPYDWTELCARSTFIRLDEGSLNGTDLIFVYSGASGENCNDIFVVSDRFRLADYVGEVSYDDFCYRYEYFAIPQERWEFLYDGTSRLRINFDAVCELYPCGFCSISGVTVSEVIRRIYYEPAIPVQEHSWGEIKSLYR